jgi:hypothetical protein
LKITDPNPLSASAPTVSPPERRRLVLTHRHHGSPRGISSDFGEITRSSSIDGLILELLADINYFRFQLSLR